MTLRGRLAKLESTAHGEGMLPKCLSENRLSDGEIEVILDSHKDAIQRAADRETRYLLQLDGDVNLATVTFDQAQRKVLNDWRNEQQALIASVRSHGYHTRGKT